MVLQRPEQNIPPKMFLKEQPELKKQDFRNEPSSYLCPNPSPPNPRAVREKKERKKS